MKREPQIGQTGSRRVPAVLESDEPVVITVGASQIELFEPGTDPVQDCIPDQVRHSAVFVKSNVRCAVLVIHTFTVTQRDDPSYWNLVLVGAANFGRRSEAVDKIAEPT